MTKPFLKWPGGKRWLATQLTAIIVPLLQRRYYEPFLGGGAVFFALGAHEATLSDVNGALIETYMEVQRNWARIGDILSVIPVDAGTYYRIRAESPSDSLSRAVRFLYLNRTAFGGMYRESLRGQFNVPFGGGQRTPEILWQTDILERASKALESAKLLTSEFEPVIEEAGRGDVVYCDPTYNAPTEREMFIRYNGIRFTWRHQESLADAAFRARERGAAVLVSNMASPDIDQLYQGAEKLDLSRVSCLSAKGEARRKVTETLYLLRPSCDRRSGALA